MSNDTTLKIQHLEQEVASLKADLSRAVQLAETLGEALLDKTNEDTQRYQQLTQNLAGLGRQISEVVENMTVAPKVSREVATYVGQQIENLFQNPIMLDGIATALLHRQLSALQERARTSKDRQPRTVLVKMYFPGVVRILMTEQGVVTLEQQVEGATTEHEGWVLSEELMSRPEVVSSFAQMMATEGLDADTYYYITDDITLQNKQEEAQQRLQDENIAQLEREAAIRDANQQGQAPQTPEADLAGPAVLEEPAPFESSDLLQFPVSEVKAEDQQAVKAIDRLTALLNK